MILTRAKLVFRSEVEGLDLVLGHVQVYLISQKDGLISTDVGVANGCLEEL